MSNINRGSSVISRFSRGVFAALFLLIAVAPNAVSAATTTPSAGSASGLSISPLRQQLSLSPGGTSQSEITLKNITGGPVTAIPTLRDFTSDGVDGNPKILSTNQNSPSSIRSFVTGLNKISLATGEQKTFSIGLRVPSTATPGAYFGLIEYQAIPANNGAQPGENSKVALTAAVSQLIFITVPGNVTQLMQVKSINVYHDTKGTDAGLFFTSPPKSIGVDVANLANAFEQPYGTLQIQSSGGKVQSYYQVNNGVTRGIVLPNSTRVFINPIKKVTTPGPYTVVASITYGSGGSNILVAKKTFWYIPMWLIIVALVVILILIGIVAFLFRRYRRGRVSKYKR